MSNVGRYVMRVLADRMIQPGKWHIVSEDVTGNYNYIKTRCGRQMWGRRYNLRWSGATRRYEEGAEHTLAFSDFPRDARTQDRDDTNVCSRCS